MTADPVIRRAIASDAVALSQLVAEHAEFERAAPSVEGHAARLRQAIDEGEVLAWIAENGSGAIGYASATLDFSTFAARRFLHMDCLYLRSGARNAGTGAALMHEVLQYARSVGVAEVQWQTPDWNTGAQRFYGRLRAVTAGKIRYVMRLETAGAQTVNHE